MGLPKGLWPPLAATRWILPFSHDNMRRKSLVDQMAEDEDMGDDCRYAQARVLFLQHA